MRSSDENPSGSRSNPRSSASSTVDAVPSAVRAAHVWRTRGRSIALDRPVVMGILNVTPDSFSDGGRFLDRRLAVEQAERLVDEGADLLDIGGESTRPQGAEPVGAEEELARILPVIRGVRAAVGEVPISVDTNKAAVAREALGAGAEIINDVSALRLDPALGAVVAEAGAGLVLMHSRGTVRDMATFAHATYGDDPVGEVAEELRAAVARASAAGVEREAIVLDPGIGFSKRGDHSLAMLAGLDRLAALGFPLLVGVSRKRFIGEIGGVREPSERVFGTVGANVAALLGGARIFRVHDVRANRQALDVAWQVVRAKP